MKTKNFFIRKLWSFVYRKWIDKSDRVISVLGWRTALIETKYRRRRTVTPCFWIFQ